MRSHVVGRLTIVDSERCKIRPFGVCAVIIMFIGISLSTTGLVMRLEKVPAPLHIQLHTCMASSPTTEQGGDEVVFVGSGRPCSDDITRQVATPQVFPLDGVPLLSDVEYVTYLLQPHIHVSGNISIELWRGDDLVYDITHKLAKPKFGERKSLQPATDMASSHIPIYNSFSSPNQKLQRCDQIESGCLFQLPYAMSKLIFDDSRFLMSARDLVHEIRAHLGMAESVEDEDMIPPHLQLFLPNITLVVRWLRLHYDAKELASIVNVGVEPTPLSNALFFLSFHQYSLSYVQNAGVATMILGFATVMAGTAFYCVVRFLNRSKQHQDKFL